MIRWYQSINAPYFACLICHIQSSTKLKRFEAEVPKHWKHCIFGWLWHFSACEAELRGLISWHVELSLTKNLSLQIAQMPMALWLKKNKCLGSQNGLPKRLCLHLPISACKKTDPACANCFGAVASLGWRRNQMLRIRREGRRVANHDRSHFQPFSKDVTYATHEWFKVFKEQRSTHFPSATVSHTSLLIPSMTWKYPSLLATFRWEGLWNDRFSRAPRHCVQTKIVWKFIV